MEITYLKNNIEKRIKKKTQSDPIARRNMTILANAPCYLDITGKKAHFLIGDKNGCFRMDFNPPSRLICEPIGAFKNKDGRFIKETITSIQIVKIETDYH